MYKSRVVKNVLSIFLLLIIGISFVSFKSDENYQVILTKEEKNFIDKYKGKTINIGLNEFFDNKYLQDIIKDTFKNYFNVNLNIKIYKKYEDAYRDIKDKKIDYVISLYRHDNDLVKSESMYEEEFFIAYKDRGAKTYMNEITDASFFYDKVSVIRAANPIIDNLKSKQNKGETILYNSTEEGIDIIKNSPDNAVMLVGAEKVPQVCSAGLSIENILPNYRVPIMYLESREENKVFIDIISKYINVYGSEFIKNKMSLAITKDMKNTFVNTIVNENERDFINNNEEIIVNIVDANYPILFKENGEEKGLAVDDLNGFSEITGLNIRYNYIKKREEVNYSDMKENEIYIDFSANMIGENIYNLDTDLLVIGNGDEESKYDNIAVLENSFEGNYFKNIGIKIKEYKTRGDIFKAYDNGEIDYLAIDRYTYYNELINHNHDMKIIDQVGIDFSTNLFIFKENGVLGNLFHKAVKNMINTVYIDTIWSSDVEKRTYETVKNYNEKEKDMFIIKAVAVGLGGLAIFLVVCMLVYRNKNKELKRKDDIVKVALKEAKAADKAKSIFLANVSHEIRTPINAVMGMSEVGLNDYKTDKEKERYRVILKSSKYLLKIVNDILDMSKMEYKNIVLENEKMSLKEVAAAAEFFIRKHVSDRKQVLTVNLDSSLEEFYIGDTIRLTQVIVNLLSNASKFTKQNGSLTLDIKKLKSYNNEDVVEVSITDTGIGIPSNKINKLFEPFYQIRSSGMSYLGTGLGLPICKNIVETMGGSIKVRSEVGEGSSFTFSVNLKKINDIIDEKDEKPTKDKSLKGLNILLVDDVEINRIIVMELLNDKETNIIEAENGQEAMDIFNKSKLGYFDVILMDVQMPEIDGNEATKLIRNLDRSDAKSVKIIGMSANAFKEDIRLSKECGMNDYIMKPLEIDKLIKLLRESVE